MSAECYNNKEVCRTEDRRQGGTVVRFFVAAVLLLAAGLKAYQLATVPSLGEGILHARWFNILVVEFEIFFAFWLISGLLPKLTWLASIGLFSIFALVSLFKAISGETSCGCFGAIQVNPWITATFDCGIVVILFQSKRQEEMLLNTSRHKVLIACFCIGLLMSTLVLYAVSQYSFLSLADGNVSLELKQWIGQPFPLQKYISTEKSIQQGTWLVLFYNNRCSACRESVALYEKFAAEFSLQQNSPQIVLIEVPPFEKGRYPSSRYAVRGHLNGVKGGKFPTPVSFLIDNGTVQNVFTNPRDTDLIYAIWGGER